MNNLLSDQAIRELRQLYKDVTTLKNRLANQSGTGPRVQQQLYARIIGFDSSNVGYDATEVMFGGGGPNDWSDIDGGRRWGDETDEIGMLYAIDSTFSDFEGVHPVFRFSDGTQSYWGFIGLEQAADETVSFRHTLDGSGGINFYDGTVMFNDRVDVVVTDGGGMIASDGHYYVQWNMTAGSYSHETSAEIQYNASRLPFWQDSSDGTVTIRWPLAEIKLGVVKVEWEGDIIGQGSGMPGYTDMTDGYGDPTVGVYAGVMDATQVSDRTDHDYFFEMVKSVDKYVQGIQYSHSEDQTYKFGGLSKAIGFDYVSDVSADTSDQIFFPNESVSSDYDYGLLQDGNVASGSNGLKVNVIEWLGTNPGNKSVDIIHKKSPVTSTSDSKHWKTLNWDGTNFGIDGTVVDAWDMHFDINNHVWAVNDQTSPGYDSTDYNYRFTPCSGFSGETKILSEKTNNVAYIDGGCWEFDSTTLQSVDSTASAWFNTCEDCDSSSTNEQWVDESDVQQAVLSSTHTDVDYAWLCISSAWKRCKSSGNTLDTATNPTVLKQCGVAAPISFAQLVGWHGSDDFGGSGCHSSTRGDTNWSNRWTTEGTFSNLPSPYGIVSGQVQASVVAQTTQNEDWYFRITRINHSSDFTASVDMSVTPSPSGVDIRGPHIYMLLTIGGGFYSIGMGWTSAADGKFWFNNSTTQQYGANDFNAISDTLTISRSANTLTFKFGSNTAGTVSVSGSLTEIEILMTNGGSGTGTYASGDFTVDNFSLLDGSSNEINLDPTGEACT